MTTVIHYPKLDTILMLENFIKEWDGHFKKKKLWEQLPKKMMYQTFCVAFDYLVESRKISVDSEGKIGWIFYPEDVKKLVNEKRHLFLHPENLPKKI